MHKLHITNRDICECAGPKLRTAYAAWRGGWRLIWFLVEYACRLIYRVGGLGGDVLARIAERILLYSIVLETFRLSILVVFGGHYIVTSKGIIILNL